jgi:hypothetical protein
MVQILSRRHYCWQTNTVQCLKNNGRKKMAKSLIVVQSTQLFQGKQRLSGAEHMAKFMIKLMIWIALLMPS